MTIAHSLGKYEVDFLEPSQISERFPSNTRIITDENVAKCWSPMLTMPHLVLPAGESTKSLEWFSKCHSWLVESGATRKTTLVALGGGVIGDLIGFVAATYMRGIPFIQVPTTLLSQVDSSVGGKVAIDIPEGKNLVGAFYPPKQVLVSVEFLKTLSDRHFTNGLAELWKHGYILDKPFLDRLRKTELSKDSPILKEFVEHSIGIKAKIVQADEFERLGLRAKLNFGHTVGHAIERVLGYQDLLHGEAISIGMVVESRLGERLGITRPGVSQEIAKDFEKIGLPTRHVVLNKADQLIKAMRSDKKSITGDLAFSLLHDLGECKLYQNIAESDVRASLKLT